MIFFVWRFREQTNTTDQAFMATEGTILNRFFGGYNSQRNLLSVLVWSIDYWSIDYWSIDYWSIDYSALGWPVIQSHQICLYNYTSQGDGHQ